MRGVLSMKKRIESDILTAFQHEARGWQARAGNEWDHSPSETGTQTVLPHFVV
jgi:hypothetical protein